MKRKLPHFRFPGFKILDRYILGKFLSTYFFAIAMIIVVVVIFDYVEKIDNFTETKAPLKAIIFDYYLNFIPFFIQLRQSYNIINQGNQSSRIVMNFSCHSPDLIIR